MILFGGYDGSERTIIEWISVTIATIGNGTDFGITTSMIFLQWVININSTMQ